MVKLWKFIYRDVHFPSRIQMLFLIAILSLPAFAQQRNRIEGVVVDEKTQEPVIGAEVLLVNEKKGTISDTNGKFAVVARSFPATVSVSFIGYKTLDVTVYEYTEPITVKLSENLRLLDEVVVIGYGTQKRKELTGAISSVSQIALSQQTLSFDKALGGAVAGLSVTQSSGQPGATSSIRIRGSNSITGGNEPLYVIDGLIVYNDNSSTRTGIGTGSSGVGGGGGGGGKFDGGLNPLTSINSADIESIEVLKDVSATAIYGARGANGVIVITTKKGKRGHSNINYQGTYSSQKISKKLELLNADEWAALYQEIDENGNNPYTQYPGNHLQSDAGTDWQSALLQTGATQSHQLSLSGGGEDYRYLISGNYNSQEGIIRNTGVNRYVGRINLDKDVFKKLNAGVNLTAAQSVQQGLTNLTGNESAGRVAGTFDYALRIPSVIPIYTGDGDYNYANPFETGDMRIGNRTINPLSDLLNSTVETQNTSILGNFYAQYSILPSLVAKVNAGVNLNHTTQNFYAPSTAAVGLLVNGFASIGNKSYNSNLFEFTLNYKEKFNDIHSLEVLGGYTKQRTKVEYSTSSSSNFTNEVLTYHNLASAATLITPTSGGFEAILNSVLGRVNYSLLERYNFSATFRADGSSRFAPGHQWGYFPSVGASWNIDQEPFFGKNAVSSLKLRGSAGRVGNQEIGNYLDARTYTPRNYSFGNQIVVGYTMTNYGNGELKWESTAQYNVGLDAGLWKDRLSVTIDAYYKKTYDLLVNLPVERTTGLRTKTVNIGDLSNKGIELSINAKLIERKDLNWTLLANISKNVNRILKLGVNSFAVSGVNGTQAHIVQEGEALGSFYGYVFDGLVQQDEVSSVAVPGWVDGVKAGDAKYVNQNGDKVIDTSDKTILGNVHPDFTYGFASSLQYKAFDLSASFQGSQGNHLYNALRHNLETPTQTYNASKVLVNRWTPTHTNTIVPRAQASSYVNLDSRYIEDASYLRMKDITLGYALPLKSAFFASTQARVFVSGQNLLTLTNYTGYDPEASRNGNDESSELTQGVDLGAYPTAKSFLVGINITF
ncbi:Outer membrane cobalamin receptor protein, SusC/RagA family [Bacteroidales bacterium Barb6]|nr:Outer membrane cobalamin receptor protein, SusC/RagA family [Bacteroidales bacterium Barb6]